MNMRTGGWGMVPKTDFWAPFGNPLKKGQSTYSTLQKEREENSPAKLVTSPCGSVLQALWKRVW